jgi:hypothetical protein
VLPSGALARLSVRDTWTFLLSNNEVIHRELPWGESGLYSGAIDLEETFLPALMGPVCTGRAPFRWWLSQGIPEVAFNVHAMLHPAGHGRAGFRSVELSKCFLVET